MQKMITILTFLIYLYSSPILALGAIEYEECVVTKVVDGDTIYCEIGNENIKVRLAGVDAPETRINSKAKRDARKQKILIETIKIMGNGLKNLLRAN